MRSACHPYSQSDCVETEIAGTLTSTSRSCLVRFGVPLNVMCSKKCAVLRVRGGPRVQYPLLATVSNLEPASMKIPTVPVLKGFYNRMRILPCMPYIERRNAHAVLKRADGRGRGRLQIAVSQVRKEITSKDIIILW